YRACPPAKAINSKLKKVEIKIQLVQSREHTPKQSQKGQETCTGPPPSPAKRPNILVPARHSTQRKHTDADMYMTRLARKFPRVQYTQLWQTSHKTINKHTPVRGTTMSRKQRKFLPIESITAYDIILSK
ncbi:MAG: hypothetical protein ACK559_24670, partial [bacterium]